MERVSEGFDYVSVGYGSGYVVQCLFLVYCFAPTSWNGSLTIYHKVIRPFVLKHEKNIDSLLDRGARAAREGIVEGAL
jgi:receptor expression-enhancing protein 5/6